MSLVKFQQFIFMSFQHFKKYYILINKLEIYSKISKIKMGQFAKNDLKLYFEYKKKIINFNQMQK